jgi:EPS-associated MarR family transcriptional regulator
MLTDEYRYKILKELEANPEISQRELAKELGISLGKANFCIQALIEKGLIKAKNFKNSQNKKAYIYLLTPKGIEDKASVTVQFLKMKMAEYHELKSEIERLQQEAKQMDSVEPSATITGKPNAH